MLSADSLFRQQNISELRSVEQRLRQEAELKRKDLSQLVGERYRDMMEASVRIIGMRANGQEIQKRLESLHQLCQSTSIQQQIQSTMAEQSRQIYSPERKQLYSKVCQVKLLVDIPKQIYHEMEEKRFLEASLLCLLASKISTSNNASNNTTNNLLTVVERQWEAVVRLKPTLLKRIRMEVFRESENPLEPLFALLVLENRTADQLLTETLEGRWQAIKQLCLKSTTTNTTTSNDSSSRSIHVIQSIMQSTMTAVKEIFKNSATNFEAIHNKNIDIVAKIMVNSIYKHLPANIREFSIPIAKHSFQMTADVEACLAEWLARVIQFLMTETDDLLASAAPTTATLRDLRQSLLDASHNTSTNASLWKRVWEPLIERRLRAILNLAFKNAKDKIDFSLQSINDLDLTEAFGKRLWPCINQGLLSQSTNSDTHQLHSPLEGRQKAFTSDWDLSTQVSSNNSDANCKRLVEQIDEILHNDLFVPLASWLNDNNTDETNEPNSSDLSGQIEALINHLGQGLGRLIEPDLKAATFYGRLALAIGTQSTILPKLLQLLKVKVKVDEVFMPLYVDAHCKWISELSAQFKLQLLLNVNNLNNPNNDLNSNKSNSNNSSNTHYWRVMAAMLCQLNMQISNNKSISGAATGGSWEIVEIDRQTGDCCLLLLPAHPSEPLIEALLSVIHQIQLQGGHLIDADRILCRLTFEILTVALHFYQETPFDSLREIDERLPLQIYFDLLFIWRLMSASRLGTCKWRPSDQEADECFHAYSKSRDSIKLLLDPIEMRLAHSRLEASVEQSYGRYSVFLGYLTASSNSSHRSSSGNLNEEKTEIFKQPSSILHENYNLLAMMSPPPPRFPLMPVIDAHKIQSAPDSSTTAATSNSKLTGDYMKLLPFTRNTTAQPIKQSSFNKNALLSTGINTTINTISQFF